MRTLSAITMMCVAVIAMSACTLGASTSSTPTGTTSSVASPTPTKAAPAQVEVFPELGYSEDVFGKKMTGETTMSKDKVACPDQLGTPVSLSSSISLDGMRITGNKKDGVATISFSPKNDVKYGGVVNGKTPFHVPGYDSLEGVSNEYEGQSLILAEKDFGEIKTIILCGGGM